MHAAWNSGAGPIRTALANSVESDLGCTSRIYFDNVTLILHNVTLKSQKPCQHNNKCDCSKTNSYKLSYSHILFKIHKLHLFCWLNFSSNKKKWIFTGLKPTCYRTNFPYTSSGYQNGAFLYIVLCVMRLTYTRDVIWFSHCAGLSRLGAGHVKFGLSLHLNPSVCF